MNNADIARIMGEIADYLAMEGSDERGFRIRAYERAAEIITTLEEPLYDIYDRGGVPALKAVPGIGIAIAEKTAELFETGRLGYYEELRKRIPVDLAGLRRVEGLGPKTIVKLYRTLGVRSLRDLARAVTTGEIAKLPGMGEKSVARIHESLQFVRSSGKRVLLGNALPDIHPILAALRGIRGVTRVTLAGSARRARETIGDADILVVAAKSGAVMKAFTTMPNVVRVIARGDTKSSVKLASGLQVDLRVVPAASYGAASNYFTGSKDHNVALRERAIARGLKLNEYGLWRRAGQKEEMVAGKTEESIYKKLGLQYIEPELRENRGEIDAALRQAGRSKLPNLIGYKDLRGDLQVQTDWTDGAASIAEMARAAHARGLAYIAITDHTKRLAMTHGLDAKRIRKQWIEIDRANRRFKGKITVLKGTECDILPNGSLDLPDDVLAQLDIVGVSVHSRFNLTRREQTARIEKAIRHPHVDMLFHPTGRLIGRRPAYDVDMDAVIRTARETGVLLEVNAFPERSDLADEHIRTCVAKGVRIVINSDAHAPQHFDFLPLGVGLARRGWAARSDVANARSLQAFRRLIRGES